MQRPLIQAGGVEIINPMKTYKSATIGSVVAATALAGTLLACDCGPSPSVSEFQMALAYSPPSGDCTLTSTNEPYWDEGFGCEEGDFEGHKATLYWGGFWCGYHTSFEYVGFVVVC
jgi:hypothetical protein